MKPVKAKSPTLAKTVTMGHPQIQNHVLHLGHPPETFISDPAQAGADIVIEVDEFLFLVERSTWAACTKFKGGFAARASPPPLRKLSRPEVHRNNCLRRSLPSVSLIAMLR